MTYERLESLSADQDEVLTAFYDRYAQRGVNYAFGILRNRNDSEDVVHDALCRLMAPAQRHRLDQTEQDLAAIFMTAVRRLSIDVLRRRTRQRWERLDAANEPATSPDDVDGVNVRDLLEQLPSDWREALRLRVDGKLSYAQISEVLGCSVAQVRTWIYRARNQLAAELQGHGISIHR